MITMRWKLEGREWLGAAACVSVLLGLGFYQFIPLPLRAGLQETAAENMVSNENN